MFGERSEEEAILKSYKEKLIAAGKDIIDLSMINPDIPPPRLLIDRLVESVLKVSNHRYSVARGTKALRSSFSSYFLKQFNTKLDYDEEVCATLGTKDAINILMTLTEKSHVLLPTPTYPLYKFALESHGLRADFYNVMLDEGDILRQIDTFLAKGSKTVILNYPNNPTGIVPTKDFFKELISLTRKSKTLLINDFAYGDFRSVDNSKKPISLLSLAEGNYQGLIEVYTMSKAFSIPGWRVGCVAGDSKIIKEVSRKRSILDYGGFLPFQAAAATALIEQNSLTDEITESYRERGALLIESLREKNFTVSSSTIGASLWVQLPEKLREKGVVSYMRGALERGFSCSVGPSFGEGFNDYFRIALNASPAKLKVVGDLL
jgi:alanine-synthesizing transaminase